MVDPVLRIRRTTLFKRCIQAKLNDDNLGEEIRVLYVALTRAREKLILTGAVSGLEKKVERWCQSAFPQKYGLSYQNLSGAGGYLDFLMPVLFKYESAEAFLTKLGYATGLPERRRSGLEYAVFPPESDGTGASGRRCHTGSGKSIGSSMAESASAGDEILMSRCSTKSWKSA